MSTGQPLVHTLSFAQLQGELGMVIISMCGRPPVNPPVISRPHQLKQEVKSSDKPSTQVTVAPTPAQPPEMDRVRVTVSTSLLWVSIFKLAVCMCCHNQSILYSTCT